MTYRLTQKPDVCIYHHPCADGFTAAWAVWTRWPDIEFLPAAYQGALPDVAGKHVLLVDFSYKAPVLRELAATAASITVLDHHDTAQKDLAPLLEEGVILGEFDMTRSGAKMAWDAVWPTDLTNPFDFPGDAPGYVPALVRYVQDRDLWNWSLEKSKEISAYIQTKPLTFEAWQALAMDLEVEDTLEAAIHTGDVLIKKTESELRAGIKATGRRMVIAGYDVPVANLPHFLASEAGNILAKGEPFAAIYFDTADGQRSFSLRSDKDDPNAVDVGQIAKLFGGGGHVNAAGFRAEAGWPKA